MTLPNKLTLLRILMIPVMVILYYIPVLHEHFLFDRLPLAFVLAGSVFVLASLTDFLDGYLARKLNLITTFGKFADPLADKILVMAALLILADAQIVASWVIIVILAREFIVSGIRLVVLERKDENKKVIAANKLGKYKTVMTMLAIIFLFFTVNLDSAEGVQVLKITGDVLIYLSLVLTIVSGIEYFWQNKEAILESI
ncbi:MAG: CDP-diacylglycerol--glycerol-3-phosphate 3-phosphatidyltransferase [Erysipelotrichales bacterium]|nr:CDP-diacylglycerol--glycerol-3-phosphate 3-phosphatidyltransferase [Erysipelotrichales bacterium]